MDEGVERGSMLTQFLALIEGKERDVASILLGDLAADHRSLLIGRKVHHV